MCLLNDVLSHDLKIIFCGTAVGNQSATSGAYYANPGNKFWSILYQTGLTPTRLTPSDYLSLLDYGLGLTDLVNSKHGVDKMLRSDDFDRDGLSRKILRFSPRVLCFNGKKAAQIFLEKKHIDFGYQEKVIGRTKIFVAPSTSGSANRYWNKDYWFELAHSFNSFSSEDFIICIDADPFNADWTKRTWDLPPYKSPEFMEYLRTTCSILEEFRSKPVIGSNSSDFAINQYYGG